MAFFAVCSVCGKKKLSIFIDADGVCSVCETKMLSQQEKNSQQQVEISQPNEPNITSSVDLKPKQSEKQEDEGLSQQAEFKIEKSECQRKYAVEQFEKRYAAYDAMLASIQEYPIVVSSNKAKKIAASFINDLTYSTITKKSDIKKLGDFVVLDTETTGLKYSSNEIIDIAAIRFRGFRPIEKFSTLLTPIKSIPKEVTAINHITDEMVKGKPCFQQVAASLIDFIGDDNIVGHNLQFDLKYIVHYGADVSVKKRKYYDTLTIAKKTIKKVKMKWDKELEDYIEDYDSDGVPDYKLETLCAYFGIINIDAHRAESDAIATGLLFQKLAEIRIDGRSII